MTFWDLIAKSWTGFVDNARMGTSHILNVVRGALYLAMLFKWITLTMEEQIGVIGAVEMILQGIAAKTTVPAARVEQKKEAAFDKGVAAGVASTGSGTGDGFR